MLLGQRVSVAKRISAYVGPADPASDPGRSLIERALGDKQARTIARSPFITRLRVEMEVADLKFGPEAADVPNPGDHRTRRWLLAQSTHSPIAALLALFVPVVARVAVKMLADRQRRQFSEQLPDNLQVIASAMRAGQTFVVRCERCSMTRPSRPSASCAALWTDEQLGIPLADALGQVTVRMKSEGFPTHRNRRVVAARDRRQHGRGCGP